MNNQAAAELTEAEMQRLLQGIGEEVMPDTIDILAAAYQACLVRGDQIFPRKIMESLNASQQVRPSPPFSVF